ncbi:hypothetical protein KSP39_PZI012732 [Platanthera zijinensis]|uniref:Phytocyanin domain-containing protein n=1 Tax=Platanthera zijinensis TaxID=2320716 RepID=A0AAP0BET0_9ASPA
MTKCPREVWAGFPTVAAVGDGVLVLGLAVRLWAGGWLLALFLFNAEVHDVLRVNELDFQSCNVPANAQPLISGHEEIPLTSEGRQWYICTKANHCELGMKLFINVNTGTEAPAPSLSGR